MTVARYIQIHSLHAYTGTLLNRDDSGMAKRLPLGGYLRTRVSSQCLKRHWREGGGEGLGLKELGETSIRTRLIERRLDPMLEASHPDVSKEMRDAATKTVALLVYGKKNYETKKRQALLFGETEMAYLAKTAGGLVDGAEDVKEVEARSAKLLEDKALRANFAAMFEAVKVDGGISGGIPGALFGRMVTADPASNIDAAIHVAHAFTVHEQESEADALTVVDDLANRELDGQGAGGMFDTEINSGLFYGYVVVDVAQLIANVAGVRQEEFAGEGVDRDLAAAVVEKLVKLIATVSPGAKKGSTAPYGYVESMLVEVGDAQPRSLAAAFHDPVKLRQNRPAAWLAADRVHERLASLDRVFGDVPARMFVSVSDEAKLGGARADSLEGLAEFAKSAVLGRSVKVAA